MIFTAFFCGTCSNSYDFCHSNNSGYHSGELISLLGYHHKGSEFVDYVVIDGPGSGNMQIKDQWVASKEYSKPHGTVTGAGWESNVKHALHVVKRRLANQGSTSPKIPAGAKAELNNAGVATKTSRKMGIGPKTHRVDRPITPQMLQEQKARILSNGPITRINLIGWSRGAVSCIMFANALNRDPQTSHIPVNIFAVDPVPGPMNFKRHRTTLTPNVANYQAIYAYDDRAYLFMPTVATLANANQATNMSILSMPGKHSTMVGGGDRRYHFHTGKIVRHLAETFLDAHGTPLRNKLNLGGHKLLELYEGALQNAAHYHNLRKDKLGIKISRDGHRHVAVGRQTRSTKMDNIQQLGPSGPFVNWHHQRLFAHHFPAVFQMYQNHQRFAPHGQGSSFVQVRQYAVARERFPTLAALLDLEANA